MQGAMQPFAAVERITFPSSGQRQSVPTPECAAPERCLHAGLPASTELLADPFAWAAAHSWPNAATVARAAVGEALLSKELDAHCGYVHIRQLKDQSMFGASSALLVRCSRTNRLRTLLQIPRAQLRQLDSRQQQELVGSLQQASDFHHPHTLQVHEVFLGPLHLHIVLEECSAGRLVDFPAKQHSMWGPAGPGGAIAALSPDFARWFFQQVVLAVEYCHTKGLAGLAVEAAVLKIVPGVPQPVVKVPTPLLAHGLSVLCSAPQSAACSTTGQPAGQQLQTSTASAADLYNTDMYACGVLLLKLLGVDLQHQQDWQQELRLMLAQQPHQQHEASLTALLQGLLEPNPDQRFQVSDVKANTWFQQQLPPAAEGMAARFAAKGRACRQSMEEIAAVMQQAFSIKPAQQQLQLQLQQQEGTPAAFPYCSAQQACVKSPTVAHKPLQNTNIALQLLSLQHATEQLSSLCATINLPMLAALLAVVPLLQHLCTRMAAVQGIRQPQQLELVLLLQLSCTEVLFCLNVLLEVLQGLQLQQPQQQPWTFILQLLHKQGQLFGLISQLVVSARNAVAAANAAWNSRISSPALQHMKLPVLPTSAPSVFEAGMQAAAPQAVAGAVLLPVAAGHPQHRRTWGVYALLQALQLQFSQRLHGALQCVQFATAEEMFGALTFNREQQQPASWAYGRVTFNANCGQQPVQVVGLSLLHSPQEGRSTAAAAPHPDLSLVSAACTPEASAHLAATLQELLHADGSSRVLAPITGMCLDPPLLVAPQPPEGKLQQWIRTAAGKVNGTNSAKNDFTAAWVASMSWSKVLQVLVDVAAALSLLHQQQQPVVHGGVHAAAVHLLQQLTHEGDTEEGAAQSPGQVCQLSLVGLLNQMAPIRSCHPFLAAPEVVLAAGPATAAADVYGFGVLMFQLATGWLPQQYTAGTDEQIFAVMWCREMLAQVGSTSPLAAAQQVLQQQHAGGKGLSTGSWTPYGKHLLSPTAVKQLPAGYLELMQSCLQRSGAARPSITLVAAHLQDILCKRAAADPPQAAGLAPPAAATTAGGSSTGVQSKESVSRSGRAATVMTKATCSLSPFAAAAAAQNTPQGYKEGPASTSCEAPGNLKDLVIFSHSEQGEYSSKAGQPQPRFGHHKPTLGLGRPPGLPSTVRSAPMHEQHQRQQQQQQFHLKGPSWSCMKCVSSGSKCLVRNLRTVRRMELLQQLLDAHLSRHHGGDWQKIACSTSGESPPGSSGVHVPAGTSSVGAVVGPRASWLHQVFSLCFTLNTSLAPVLHIML